MNQEQHLKPLCFDIWKNNIIHDHNNLPIDYAHSYYELIAHSFIYLGALD